MKLKIFLIILIIVFIITGSIILLDEKQQIEIKRNIGISIDTVNFFNNNTTIPGTDGVIYLVHNNQVNKFYYNEYRWGSFYIDNVEEGTIYEFSIEGFYINNSVFNFFESTNNFNITIIYDGNNKKIFYNESDKIQVIMETMYSDKLIISGDDGSVQLTITLGYHE